MEAPPPVGPEPPGLPFDPTVARWFAARMGAPTEIQARAWPRIAAGAHVLVSAPTGSGKTLTAFLWALDRLLTGAWDGGGVRVLYVSPLKALNTDVRVNLLAPLAGLRHAFDAEGRAAAPVAVLTRSGDTPPGERRRMARRAPEILITTPESLNVLLTSRGGRGMFGGVRTVLLDEVHALAGNKRGALLAVALERLCALAGEVQRVALSATVAPLEEIAAWVGGAGRSVEPIVSRAPKRYELSVSYPLADPVPPGPSGTAGLPGPSGTPGTPDHGPLAAADADGPWPAVVRDVKRTLARHRSTLVFANSRRVVEKLTRFLNEDEPREIAWAHHGSLSREVRRVVEERLKAGALRAIVATNSLELGIDVGALDEVVLVQSPPALASAVQRIGRAGHGVGQASRGRFVALAPRDLLDAAVCARAVAAGDIEPVRPLEAPLDVLAQALVSMVATGAAPADELYAVIRRAAPYRALPRRVFDLVLEALAGRFADARVPELRPLVSLDRLDGTVRGRPGAERLVYAAGGTIPDRGLFRLRRADGGAPIGELDEEFVWERATGDAFTLGVQTWRIEKITHNDVFVVPSEARQALAPFWRADARHRGHLFGLRIGEFLERAEPRLDDPAFATELRATSYLTTRAADALAAWLREQRERLGGLLPHRRRLVAERAHDPGGGPGWLVLHTFWGGRVNQPLALALAASWAERGRGDLRPDYDDGCLAFLLPEHASVRDLLDGVGPDNVDRLLRGVLSRTGTFGARFREAAGIALLLPRRGFGQRTPLWFTRQKAKDLLAAVARRDDFPVTLEAWRSCLDDEFDLPALRARLAELHDGAIELAEVATAEPSPFAAGVVWKRTNELMYADDRPAGAGAAAHPGLLAEVARSAHLRPRLAPALVAPFRARLQRTAPGYAPRTPEDLLDWLVERQALTRAEWDALGAAVARDHGITVAELAAGRPGRFDLDGPLVTAAQETAWVARAVGGDDDDGLQELLAARLRFDGPVPVDALARDLGADPARVARALEALCADDRVVVDELTEGAAGLEACDAENLERLLRRARGAGRAAASFAPRPLAHLAPFLAAWQGVAALGATPARGAAGAAGMDADALRDALEPLLGVPAPADLWETDVLPARVPGYRPEALDALLADSDLGWFGCGTERVAFGLAPDLPLYLAGAADDAGDVAALFGGAHGAFAFEDLVARSGRDSAEVGARLWALAWAGRATTETFAPVRRGVETGFRPADASGAAGAAGVAGAATRGRPRATLRASLRAPLRAPLRFGRWQATRPFGGAWRALPVPEPPEDALEEDARDRERARVVLDRYGIVFRDLLARELPALQWGRLFRALRLLELSGEAIGGQFFDGLPGLQFAAPAAFRLLQEGGYEPHAFWVGAADPASPCGLAPPEAGAAWPRRLASTLLVFDGPRLVVTAERRGRRLTLDLPPGHPDLPAALAPLAAQLSRAVRPLRAIACEEVNGAPAATSPYRAALEPLFHVDRDRDALRLGPRY